MLILLRWSKLIDALSLGPRSVGEAVAGWVGDDMGEGFSVGLASCAELAVQPAMLNDRALPIAWRAVRRDQCGAMNSTNLSIRFVSG